MSLTVKERILEGAKESTYTVRIPWMDREYAFKYHAGFLPWLILGGRLVYGFYFLYGGFDKLFTNGAWKGLAEFKKGELHAFLAFADPHWGLGSVYKGWAAHPTVVDIIAPLVVFGEFFIGFALLFGILTRIGFLSAAMMMMMFYLANAPANNPFLDEYLFYIGGFAILGALGAGRIFGVDHYIEKTAFVKKNPWLTWLLG
jgi:thiosulfate dehydrogenase [quinone] large subunit